MPQTRSPELRRFADSPTKRGYLSIHGRECGRAATPPTLSQIALQLCCLFLLASTAHAQSLQSWTELDLTGSSRFVDFTAPLLARLDSKLPNPQLTGGGIMADLRVASHLTLTAGYLFADLPQRGPLHVHIPLIALSLTSRAGRVRIADRNRFEQLIGFGTSPVRYRNRVLVDVPLGENGRWHAFGDDELFVDLSASNWSQNRLQLGGGAQVHDRLSVDLFYLLRSVHGAFSNTQVFGTTLRLMLTPPRKDRA